MMKDKKQDRINYPAMAWKKIRNLFDATFFDPWLPYGLNDALREMTALPRWLTNPAWQQHGIYLVPAYYSPDFENAKKYGMMLVFSNRIKEEWKKHSDVPCYVGGLILARYWEKMGWKRDPDAEGTIFFASHSTGDTLSNYDVGSVHQVLQKLDKKYHPITISLHPYDFCTLHLDKAYKDLGYQVVTAGEYVDPEFPKKLFDNFSHCKYACSNDIGTFILYSLSLGIPFFIVGNQPKVIFHGHADMPDGEQLLTKINDSYKQTYDLFNTGPITSISDEQMQWYIEESGEKEQLCLEDLRKVLRKHCLPITAKNFVKHLKIGFTRIYQGRWD